MSDSTILLFLFIAAMIACVFFLHLLVKLKNRLHRYSSIIWSQFLGEKKINKSNKNKKINDISDIDLDVEVKVA